jgi:hypothetical protein
MSKRIKELKIQACKWASENASSAEYENAADQKFAELIVRECMKMCDEVHRDYGMASDTARISKRYIKKHFGVEE